MNEHCCACTVVCHHVGPPSYCAKHTDFSERCSQWVEGYKQSPEANKHVGSDFKDYRKEEKEWEAKHWRYHFAGMALGGFERKLFWETARNRNCTVTELLSELAVEQADALIAELEKKKGGE